MTKAETLQKYLPCHATYGDFDLCVECPYNPNPGKIWEYGCVHGQDKMIDDAISLLKEQDAEIENLKQTAQSMMEGICLLKEQKDLKQKMWNALYAEEDNLEKKFIGTEEHDDWFTVYRPWLQRGFEIAIKVIAEQDGM